MERGHHLLFKGRRDLGIDGRCGHRSVAKENLRAGKGFTMQSVKPLAMDMDDSKFRPYHGDDAGSGARGGTGAAGGSCSACGAVTDDAVAAVAERLGEGVK